MRKIILTLLILLIAVPCFAGQSFKRHLEPETVAYQSLPSPDGGDQFTLNEQIKLIKYNNGSVTLLGLTANFSLVNGTAFITSPSVDLRKYPFKHTITETTHTLIGYYYGSGTGEIGGGTIWKADASAFTTGVYSYTPHGVATVANDGAVGNPLPSLKVTSNTDTLGGYELLRSASDLTENLVQYALYKLTWDSIVSSGTTTTVLSTNASPYWTKTVSVSATSFTTSPMYSAYWTAWSTTGDYIYTGVPNGQDLWFDNTNIYRIYSPSQNGIWIWDKTVMNWVSGSTTINPVATSYTDKITRE
jgi:hypothetical protein